MSVPVILTRFAAVMILIAMLAIAGYMRGPVHHYVDVMAGWECTRGDWLRPELDDHCDQWTRTPQP